MKKLLLAATVGLLAVGCAKEDTINTGEKALAYLQLYVDKYYPSVKPDANGLYILKDEEGTGKPWSKDSVYTYASATIRTLGGTVSSTTEKAVSQQIGSYVEGNYYGPKFAMLGEKSSYAGVDYLYEGMKVGGTRTAIIPSYLLTTSRYDTKQKYLDACTSEVHMEYTITLCGQTNDIQRTEKDSLARYMNLHYPGEKPSTFTEDDPDGRFYFVSDSTAFIGKDTFPRDTTLQINYTGRLLNGQVFDTTLEKVAKDAFIYDASKTYEPVSVTYATAYKDIKMGSSTLITGFQGGLYRMHWVGQKAVVAFISDHGYTSSGSGQTIPPYSPLVFELELVKE